MHNCTLLTIQNMKKKIVKYYNNLRNQYLGGGLNQFAVKLNITKTPELILKSSKHFMARRASLSLGGTVVAVFTVVTRFCFSSLLLISKLLPTPTFAMHT